ncbi:MAG TPA: hypothetical protein VI386_19090 [Candidatus Sulfotelmatobacter sp.]
MPNRKTTSLPLSSTLDKKLIAYAAAVATTCAATLAMPQAAEAKVVYTPTNRTILFNGTSILDLNNDHIADFVFNGGGLGNFGAVWVRPFNSNHVIATYSAAVLPAGAEVGPGDGFVGQKAVMEGECDCSGNIYYFGRWLNATNQYLGLEITINGQHHFGWARLTMVAYGKATLTGYAYETVAGKAIVTGVTSTSEDDAGSNPGQSGDASLYMAIPSLGLLARGAEGLELWRRIENVG